MRFVDTNVLLYAISPAPAEALKASRAAALLNATDLALSAQVLQEFYVQATRRSASAPITHASAEAFMRSLLRFPVQPITPALVFSAVRATERWRISFWDAAIIEAARALGCTTVWSEDLQDGQDFDGVRVQNPFVPD